MLALVGATNPSTEGVPRYDHIFLIIDENKSAKIIGGPEAPFLTMLSQTYGYASRYYAVTHPSEPNYVAIVGGYTFGILDDDAFYCHHGDKQPYCKSSWFPFYPNHTIDAPNIGTQLATAHLTWKEYLQSIPSPGSLSVVASDPKDPAGPEVYASKHSGLINFVDVQTSSSRAQELVGFDQLGSDLLANHIPNLAVIIPNLCNDMHGMRGDGVPEDCQSDNISGLVARGDAHAKAIVDEIMATQTWKSKDLDAIVITFDEDDHQGKEGCCGINKDDPANSGGGHIPAIIITNHGPRAMTDATHYSHYSLLRTMEDAFGITVHLSHAGDPGVVPMVKLFTAAGL